MVSLALHRAGIVVKREAKVGARVNQELAAILAPCPGIAADLPLDQLAAALDHAGECFCRVDLAALRRLDTRLVFPDELGVVTLEILPADTDGQLIYKSPPGHLPFALKAPQLFHSPIHRGLRR
jgi:hypothetical protein